MKKALKTMLIVLLVLLNVFVIGFAVLDIALGTADGADYMELVSLLLVDIPLWIIYRKLKPTV